MSKSSEDKIENHDWQKLVQMRSAYLGEKAQTLWSDARSLQLYDQFFGRRISDKWLTALRLVSERGGSNLFLDWAKNLSAPVQVWDWGCGTGRASRTFLEYLNFRGPLELVLTDKLPLVEDWAWDQVKSSFEYVKRIPSAKIDISNFVLLVSHVLNELTSSQAGALSDVASRAEWIFWVENGSKATSRHLALVRNKIRHTHEILAPCLGQGTCQAVEGKPHSHWCHFFANPTGQYFIDPVWADFSKNLGVDLRSIPFSFFVARRKQTVHQELIEEGQDSFKGMRLGRARLYKGYADVLVCDQNTELREWRYPKKAHGQIYKDLKKDILPAVMSPPLNLDK